MNIPDDMNGLMNGGDKEVIVLSKPSTKRNPVRKRQHSELALVFAKPVPTGSHAQDFDHFGQIMVLSLPQLGYVQIKEQQVEQNYDKDDVLVAETNNPHPQNSVYADIMYTGLSSLG